MLVDEATATAVAAQLAAVLFDSHADLLWAADSDFALPVTLTPSPIIGQPVATTAEVLHTPLPSC